jgi:hypothetical protein
LRAFRLKPPGHVVPFDPLVAKTKDDQHGWKLGPALAICKAGIVPSRGDSVAIPHGVAPRRLLETLMAIPFGNVGDGLRRHPIRRRVSEDKSKNGYSLGISVMDSLSIRSEAAIAVLSLWRVVLNLRRNWQLDFRIVENSYKLVLGTTIE